MDNNSIILYINTNNHPVSFILDDVLEETVDANSVWFINTSRNHFLNMVTTENVYIHIFSENVFCFLIKTLFLRKNMHFYDFLNLEIQKDVGFFVQNTFFR